MSPWQSALHNTAFLLVFGVALAACLAIVAGGLAVAIEHLLYIRRSKLREPLHTIKRPGDLVLGTNGALYRVDDQGRERPQESRAARRTIGAR